MRILQNRMDISVVILNYLRPSDTVDCINSLINAGVLEHQIIVVDNHSPDNSVEHIIKIYPNIRMHVTDANLGYTGGMNAGAAIALMNSTKYIFVTNSDVIIYPDTLYQLIDSLDSDESSAVAVPTIYFYNSSGRIWYEGGEIDRIRSSGFPRKRKPVKSEETGVQSVGFFSGCSFMVKSTVWNEIGKFDERYFMYQEDVELSFRLTNKGYKILYIPGARIDHKVNEGQIKPLPLYYSVRNRLLFASTQTRWSARILSYSYLFGMILIKYLRWIFLNPMLSRALFFAVGDFISDRFHQNRHVNLFIFMITLLLHNYCNVN